MEKRTDQELLEYLFSSTPSELADALNDPAIVHKLTQMGMGPDPSPENIDAPQYDPVPEGRTRGSISADEAARRNRKRLGL